MLATLNTNAPLMSVRCGTPLPRPIECPIPLAPPEDALDFTKIDTAEKAALLPVTEPAIQLSLAAGVIFAAMAGGFGGAIPLVTIDAASKAGDKLMNVTYTLDLKNEEAPLSVMGSVDGQEYNETFSIDQNAQTASLAGNIGNNPTLLTFGMDEASEALTLTGQLGDVAANLKFTAIKGEGGDDDFKGIHVEGTLGDKEYSLDTNFGAMAEQLQAGSDDGNMEATMEVRGHLGGAEISKDYKVSAQELPTGMALNFAGSGTTAGVAQEVNVTMTLTA